ncbi:hypothetical protein PZA11_005310 [Diplocarpon coronariae]|uniref:Alpha-acetolactate decarboxylase n=1 Tax=Diplocarpon coronariae TaxID=2795749 RepID=A0A218ZFS3_9HELO|nr:acetolactate decarboxylase [Diplocarpon mali]OWP06125.1 hypothetical protein B2J93_1882 [Marssonina coronariae]
MAPNDIYQFSLISALMSGLASSTSSTPISSLLTHGTFGVGTFESMDGEMIVLDSTAYQFHADGSTNIVSPSQLVPFAMVSDFQPQKSQAISLPSKQAMLDTVDDAFPHAKNAFVLFRLQGRFRHVRIRAIHKQAYAGQKLAELAEGQMVREFANVEGTVVGLRSPRWSEGVSVVGVHAHFIDEGRAFGGHVLGIEGAGEVRFEGSVGGKLELELPGSTEFGERELELDRAGIRQAEG